jgi:hypothetical protein
MLPSKFFQVCSSKVILTGVNGNVAMYKTKETASAVVGELGVLKYVHSQQGGSLRCYIVIEHEHEKYVGELLFHDQAFARRITLLLRSNIGRSIKEIGDIEIA